MAMTPAALPSIGDEDRGGAVLAQALGLGVERAGGDAELGQERWRCRAPRAGPRPCRSRPCRSGESKPLTATERDAALLRGRDDGGRQRMLARALDAGREPQHVGLVEARAGTTATTFGLPSVSVPVLSTTSVSTFSMRSSASAFLISTPAWAPRPTPTMIDIGVASPSAQGQAMISTDTAATRP